MNPFKVSNTKTNIANNLFPVLKTLVVPGLPEPIFLISPNPNNFGTKYAKGIEPKR